MYARIAFPIPRNDFFTYRIPEAMRDGLRSGMLVTAPFGSQAAIGVVLEIVDSADMESAEIREISGIGDPELAVPPDLLDLSLRASKRYGTSAGMVLKAALPPGTLQRKKAYFYPGPVFSDPKSDELIGGFLGLIKERPGELSYSNLKGFDHIGRGKLDELIAAGVISTSSFKGSRAVPRGKERRLMAADDHAFDLLKRGSKSELLLAAVRGAKDGISVSELKKQGFSPTVISGLLKKGLVKETFGDRELSDRGGMKSMREEAIVDLTLWQKSALEKIEGGLRSDSYRGFLLYGVTSSGKTQVYMEAAREAMELGKSVLMLVPEIALTPQIISRFESFFKVPPLIWHSNLNPTERAIVYKAAASGKARLLVGARSAVFSPMRELGLIIVDEEQDHSYKQDDPAPRYNARDLAIIRGNLIGAVVVLGSATPSAESYHAAKTGELELLSLPQRVAGRGNPGIEIISTVIDPDSSSDEPPIFPKGFWPISRPLHAELSVRIKNKEQVIILLNRRGYSSSVVCFECGWLGKCPDCEIGWTYHKTTNTLICHYCGQEQKGLLICPECGSARLSFRGAGTQRVEETLNSLFPGAEVKRLDSDSVSKKWESRETLDRFSRGEFKILLGTQMVAKGHHFPEVGFVAVIGADIGISLPDFRASERALQLLIQAAGRAGRSSKRKDSGLVMVQTFSPGDPVFEYLKRDDYVGFLENELSIRENLGYPPFRRLIMILVSSIDRGKALGGIKDLKSRISPLAAKAGAEILGPAPSPMLKRGKQYRYQMLMKISPSAEPESLLDSINSFSKGAKGMSIRVDVDPVTFL